VLLCNSAVRPMPAAKAGEAVAQSFRQQQPQIGTEGAQKSRCGPYAGPTTARHATHQVEKNDASHGRPVPDLTRTIRLSPNHSGSMIYFGQGLPLRRHRLIGKGSVTGGATCDNRANSASTLFAIGAWPRSMRACGSGCKTAFMLEGKKAFCSQTGYLQHGYPPRDAFVFTAHSSHFETCLSNSVKRIQKQPIDCERSR